jgi:hypothetical protein
MSLENLQKMIDNSNDSLLLMLISNLNHSEQGSLKQSNVDCVYLFNEGIDCFDVLS